MFIREVHVVRWLEENYPDLEFGVAPIPALTESVSAGGPYMFTVSADSPNKDAAWQLVEYMMSDEAYRRYVGIGGIIPTTSSVAALPEYRDDPVMRVFLQQEMRSLEPFPRDQRAAEILGAYLERFCYGQLTLEETLDRAEKDIDGILSVNRPVDA